MAEDQKIHRGEQRSHQYHGNREMQPLELNWAGGDVYRRDLLNLDDVDNELLNVDAYSDGVRRGLFSDINVDTLANKGRLVRWAQREEAHLQEGTPRHDPPVNVLTEYPPTLLELEVQALAKAGVVKLYHDGRDLERENARAREEEKLALINRFDRDRQALSPVHSRHQRHVQVPARGYPRTSGGADLLEPQTAALSTMKRTRTLPAAISTSAAGGGGDLLERQILALSSMKRALQAVGPAAAPLPNSGGDFLELQKVALASMKKPFLHTSSLSPALAPVLLQPGEGGDLSALQRAALGNMRSKQEGSSVAPPLFSKAQVSIPRKVVQQTGGEDLLELQKVALKSIARQPAPAPQEVGGDLLELQQVALRNNQKQQTYAPASAVQQAGGHLLEHQKVALRNIPKQPAPVSVPAVQQAEGDLLELQKLALRNAPRQPAPGPAVKQSRGELLELQKAVSRNSPEQLALTPPALQQAAGGRDLLEPQKGSQRSFPSQPASPAHQLAEGRGLLEQQKGALANTSSEGGTVVFMSTELKQIPDAQTSHLLGGTKNRLGVSSNEEDERRKLIEELLKELQTIDEARREAQHGFKLQIEKNEQLIAEVQQFDAVPLVPTEPIGYPSALIEIKPQESLIYKKQENASDQTSENPCDHVFEDGSDGDGDGGGNAGFSSPTSMGSAFGNQLTKALDDVETKVLAELQAVKQDHHQPKRIEQHQPKQNDHYPPKRWNHEATAPDALWKHLKHFVQKPPEAQEVGKIQLSTQLINVEGNLEPVIKEVLTQLEHRTSDIVKQMHQLKFDLLQEQKNSRKNLTLTTDSHSIPATAPLEHRTQEISGLHDRIHRLETSLCQEWKDNQKAPTLSTSELRIVHSEPRTGEVDELHRQLDQVHRELLQEKETSRNALAHLGRRETAWQAEKQKITKQLDDLETRLLKEEATRELEVSTTSTQSQPSVHNLGQPRVHGALNPSHFFQKQGREEGRELLDLRCEVLSLQDCLDMKTRAFKTTEKELERSYNLVSELRSKLRASQESKQDSLREGRNMDLIERLKTSEGKVQRFQDESAEMSKKINDLVAQCKYLEEFEHVHREGADTTKEQAIEELERELERNVQIIKRMQARCDEYETRAKQAEAGNKLQLGCQKIIIPTGGSHHEIVGQLHDEKEALTAECNQLNSEVMHYRKQIDKKDQLLIQLQVDMQSQKKRLNPSPSKNDVVELGDGEIWPGALSSDQKLKKPKVLANSDSSKVQSPEVTTLRELLREQWKLQKVMEDRLNIMMTYVSDRVNEFEQESPSDATSESSVAPTAELNHFHVEAKLMKLQLDQQLQLLRGTLFTSGDHAVGGHQLTKGQNADQLPQSNLSSQNLQLLVEKIALEDSAQTLQEKTSRLLNKLTAMRSELGENVAASDISG